jgi:hypothetical protein
MPPKKRPGKEHPVKGSSQAVGSQVLKTTQATIQSQASVEPHLATAETRRSGEPPEQLATQVEVLAMNTSAPSMQQPPQHQEIEAPADQQQDSEEEIEAIIEDELACLRQ